MARLELGHSVLPHINRNIYVFLSYFFIQVAEFGSIKRIKWIGIEGFHLSCRRWTLKYV